MSQFLICIANWSAVYLFTSEAIYLYSISVLKPHEIPSKYIFCFPKNNIQLKKNLNHLCLLNSSYKNKFNCLSLMEEAIKCSYQIRPSFLVFKVLLLQKVPHYFIIGIFCLPDYSMLILSLNSGNFLSVWLLNKLTNKTNNPKAHLLLGLICSDEI